MMKSGLYIVELSNKRPISVNAQDPRMADRCVKVNHTNCKVGKARSFEVRERNYFKTFGEKYVLFRPIALTESLREAETAILRALSRWRLPGNTGRKTEWLVGIPAAKAQSLAIAALRDAGILFTLPPKVK